MQRCPLMNIYKATAAGQAAVSDSHVHTHRHVLGVWWVLALGGGYLEMSFTGCHQNCPVFIVSFPSIRQKKKRISFRPFRPEL